MLTLRRIWLRMRTIWLSKWKRRKKRMRVKLTRAFRLRKMHAASRARLISQRSSAAISEGLGRLSDPRMSLRRPMTFTSPTDPAEGPVAQRITRSSTIRECKKSIWRGCIRVIQSSWSCPSSLSALTPLTQLLVPSMRTQKKSISLALNFTLKLKQNVRESKLKSRGWRVKKDAELWASTASRSAAKYMNRMAKHPLACLVVALVAHSKAKKSWICRRCTS